MTQKNFNTIAGCVFVIVAIIHLWRAMSGTTLMFGATNVPIWLSWIAGILLLVMGSYGLKHGKNSKKR